ncbi:Protein transport protein yip1 [Wickerhamiella sorbophila]|uniref:Protein YIP n=1 Tax=Wickerhamiella sorbophila TaxID=45607 RepID=A0A2T0FLG0_9ASCO|nr:Protein transport protein yip1 [Wickerhamiella sorbophila]PRT55815.1 Protein transport protein yip1 [Wickerhamiella sorbophila]
MQSSYGRPPTHGIQSPQPQYAAQYGGYNPTPVSANAMGSMGTMGGGAGATSAGDFGYGDMNSGERLSTGILAAFSTSGYPGEPPLLEELGVNFGHILQKTKSALNPFSAIDQNIMDDSDLAGPFLFFLLFGLFLLLNGKVHFGYIYGVSLVGTFWQWLILNLMALKSIDFTRTMSVLGYCMLPLVVISALGVVFPLDNLVGYIMGMAAICWCTYSASGFFVSYLQLSQMRVLVAYPVGLFYGIFSLMTLFAEKTVAKT